jgi:NhaP-type Na+/H+ or K+/H+ antiporter
MEPRLLAVVSVALLAFGVVSRRAERSFVSPPMVFVLLGLALGTSGLGWLELEEGGGVVHRLAEITLALVLFTDASRIDLSCLRRERSIPLRLLGIGLPLTIVLGAVVALPIFPGLGIWEALLLAAVLAPTDAALGQSVVSSPLLPVRIRQSLNVESGLNDGIVLPVVLLVASLAGARAEGGDLTYWLRFTGAQLVLGPIVGLAVGYLGGRVIERATASGWINDAFERLTVLGLAGLAFAGAQAVGGNGFIAAFVAGLALGNTTHGICRCLYEFGEADGQLLTQLVFLIFGGVMVPEAISAWDGRALLYAVASLTVIRMLPAAMSLLGSGLRPASVAMLAWFGPRGLASILFALLVVEEGRLASGEMLGSVVVLTVLLSIFAHGISAYPLSRRYGARVAASRDSCEQEHLDVPEMPVRIRHDPSPGFVATLVQRASK